jgi:hypothetical protein
VSIHAAKIVCHLAKRQAPVDTVGQFGSYYSFPLEFGSYYCAIVSSVKTERLYCAMSPLHELGPEYLISSQPMSPWEALHPETEEMYEIRPACVPRTCAGLWVSRPCI